MIIAAPRIVFNNTWRGTGSQEILFPTKPQRLRTASPVRRSVNETEEGRTQTLFRSRKERIEMEFSFFRDDWPTVDGSPLAAILELWESTLARESFTLWVHRDYLTNYPASSSLLIRQPLTVKWTPGFDELEKLRTENVRNLWGFKLSMECEDGSAFSFA